MNDATLYEYPVRYKNIDRTLWSSNALADRICMVYICDIFSLDKGGRLNILIILKLNHWTIWAYPNWAQIKVLTFLNIYFIRKNLNHCFFSGFFSFSLEKKYVNIFQTQECINSVWGLGLICAVCYCLYVGRGGSLPFPLNPT